MTDITITNATAADSTYITHLMRQNYEALSFIPQSAIERESAKGRVLLARVGGDEAGYLYHSPLLPATKIHQSCIQYDARGFAYGRVMVGRLLAACRANGVQQVSLRCADDLPANAFWRDLGFQRVGQVAGGKARGRTLNLWLLPVAPDIFGMARRANAPREIGATHGPRAAT